MVNQSEQRVEVIVNVADVRRQVAEHWGWFFGLGLVFLIAGFAAIAFPLLSTIAAKVALGWIFMLSGLVAILHSFRITAWGGFLLNLILGALYIFVGAYLAFFPLTGIITLTLLLAVLFLAEGLLQVAMAWRVRPHEGWGWLFLSGCIAIGAGALIALGLPGSATWAIGLLVGINLLSTGMGFVLLGLAGRRAKARHGG